MTNKEIIRRVNDGFNSGDTDEILKAVMDKEGFWLMVKAMLLL